MMKIYVGGKYQDASIIRENIYDLIDVGYTVTHDWTSVEQHDRGYSALGKYAQYDIEGVSESDIVILIMDDPEYAYRGTFTELGCALGLDKRIIIVNPHENSYCMSNCFYHHPSIIHVKTWSDVFRYL